MNSQPEAAPQISGRQTLRFAVLGVAVGFVFPVLASIIKLAALGMPITLSGMVAVQRLEPVLWITDTAPLFLGLAAGIAGRRQDRVMQANAELRQRELELGSIRSGLEVSVLERTRELDERNAQMRSVMSFARQIADIQDLGPLLQTAVDIIHEQLGGHDVNLYLIDERGQAALLRASSSPEGKGLVESGFRVSMADQGLVGRVARRGKLLTSNVRSEEPTGKAAAGQTLTAQVAIPLVVHSRVIGVLEVLLPTAQPLGQYGIEILQLVGDQLASTIQSVQQASESRATVQQLEDLTAAGTRAAWYQYLRNNRIAYQFTPAGVRAVPPEEAARPPETGSLGIPVLLRGQRIGSIWLHTRHGALAPSERDLLEKVATQVALALENVRLLEETRQRASQEQVVSEISARFSRSLDVDALLQAAVREFAALPEVAEASVMLRPSDERNSETPH